MQIFSLFLATVLIVIPVMAKELPDPGTLPGSWGYSFKLWMEEVGDWFTFGSSRTMNRLLDRTTLRLAEVHALVGSDTQDLIGEASQVYTDGWQEFWLGLEGEEELSTFTEQAVQILMEHRQSIGSTNRELEIVWSYILNSETRGLKMLLEQIPDKGAALLAEVMMDRVRMFPMTDADDILALDPLTGLLRTRGEKEVITVILQALSVLDTVPESSNRDQVQQHMMQTMRGDLVRYGTLHPDDAVTILKELLLGRLSRVEGALQKNDDAQITQTLGEISIMLGIAEEMGSSLMVGARKPAAESLQVVLENVSSRLREYSIVGHDAILRDQEMRIEGLVRILQGAPVQEDIIRALPPELLKIIPDLPWKIPAIRPGSGFPQKNVPIKVGTSSSRTVNLLPTGEDIQRTVKIRLTPFVPVEEQPAIPLGEDPSVRLRELLKEKSGTLSPIPVDLKVQAIPKVR